MRLIAPALLLSAACATTHTTHPEFPVTLADPQTNAIAVVRVPSPWWAPDFVITGKFIDVIPEYAAAPGLSHKAFTLSEDRRFGGVYLWESRAAAEGWFNEAWHQRVREKRGADGDVRVLDARWTVAGQAVPQGRALPQHGLRTDAFVTWVSSSPGVPQAERDERLRALAAVSPIVTGLIRVSFVAEPDGRVGAVSLWASKGDAEAYWSTTRRAQATAAVGSAVEVISFAAPVLLDAAAAKADGVGR